MYSLTLPFFFICILSIYDGEINTHIIHTFLIYKRNGDGLKSISGESNAVTNEIIAP